MSVITSAPAMIDEPVQGKPVVARMPLQVVNDETGEAGPWVYIEVRLGQDQDANRRDTAEWIFTRARAKLQARIDARLAEPDQAKRKPISQPLADET
jgi:hypothetical protein